MMDINTLASKIGGEIVGGRLLAVVDGKKQYLTNIGSDGNAFLNELGLKVSNELSFTQQPEAPQPDPEPAAPRRARRKPAPVENEEVPEQLELDL